LPSKACFKRKNIEHSTLFDVLLPNNQHQPTQKANKSCLFHVYKNDLLYLFAVKISTKKPRCGVHL